MPIFPQEGGGGGGIAGAITAGQVAYGDTVANSIAGDSAFRFNPATKWVKIGSATGTIDAPCHIRSNGSEQLRLETGTTFPLHMRGKNAIADEIGKIEFSTGNKNGIGRGGFVNIYTKVADNTQGTASTKRIVIDPDGWVGVGVLNTIWDLLSLKTAPTGFLTSAKNFTTAQVATTDDTITNLYTKTLTDGYVYNMTVTITARRTDGGAVENGTFTRQFKVYRDGGGATLGTVVTPWADDQLTMAATITVDTSGNDLRVRVTGEVAKSFAWFADVVYNTVFSEF